MNIKEIVIKQLKSDGYDGLYSDECACLIDDLMACDEPAPLCRAGYKKECEGSFTGCCRSNFHVVEGK